MFKNFKNDVLVELKKHPDRVIFDDDTKISFYTLLANSSAQDLLDYTNDDNAIIRSYIFVSLLRKGISDNLTKEILEKHKNDTTKFTVQGGSVVTNWTVINFMEFAAKLKATNDLKELDYKSMIMRLTEKDVIKIKMNGLKHGIISKNALLDIDCLEMTSETINVISFSLFVDNEEFNSMSCNLTKEMKLSIEKAKVGQAISFENIKVRDKDGNIRQLNSLLLKLK